MKKLLPLLLLILIGCTEPEPILISELYPKEDNIMYKLNSNRPYSGPVIGNVGNSYTYTSQEEFENRKKEYESKNPGKEYDGIEYVLIRGRLDFKGQYNNGKRDGGWYYYYEQSSNEKSERTKRLKLIRYYKNNELYKVDYYSNKNIVGTYTYEGGKLIRREP
jgi:hypothetical protein